MDLGWLLLGMDSTVFDGFGSVAAFGVALQPPSYSEIEFVINSIRTPGDAPRSKRLSTICGDDFESPLSGCFWNGILCLCVRLVMLEWFVLQWIVLRIYA
ncbi:hypothetical protein DKK75_07085 [Bifidobacterium asteroides]|uniref:Uncharacterized protein n=1 Tax=Bifidobacterium asteroides TaxID=1684 RepID=A0A318M281_9BIFI|nr:hypothetical protein DKK75_07085 [Bifidobacterium asteroides]